MKQGCDINVTPCFIYLMCSLGSVVLSVDEFDGGVEGLDYV